MPANTSLMDAARVICSMDEARERRSANRLALVNESTQDVVHLLSAWDILHFFTLELSKYHGAHSAFDQTLGSILDTQAPPSTRSVEVFPESRPLKEVIAMLSANGGGGGSIVTRLTAKGGQQSWATLSVLDIIRYMIDCHGSWNEKEANKKTLGDVLRCTKKASLVFNTNTPLFVVLHEWTPLMSADTAVVVIDATSQNVAGLLDPETLLQALLLISTSSTEEAMDDMDTSGEQDTTSTRF